MSLKNNKKKDTNPVGRTSVLLNPEIDMQVHFYLKKHFVNRTH